MENTILTSIVFDAEEIRKEVYAESACLALMGESGKRPEVITADNRALLGLYMERAFIELSAKLSGYIVGELAFPDEDSLLQMSVALPAGVSSSSFRRIAESALASNVLAACYAAQPAVSAIYSERGAACIGRLLHLLCRR